MIKQLEVVIVQSAFNVDDYMTPLTFRNKVESIFDTIFGSQDINSHFDGERLIVFPELTGLWLSVFSFYYRWVKGINHYNSIPTIAGLIGSGFLRHPFRFLASFIRGRRFEFLLFDGWKEAYDAWITPFVDAAKRFGVYICPGSSFLPYIDFDIVMGMNPKGRRIYNTSCLINKYGRILGFTRKVNLTPDELNLGVSPGDIRESMIYDTKIGRIGIAICLDGFYTGIVETLDRNGCELIVQPSANPLKWKESPRKGTSITQEEEWLGSGLGSLIQGCENIFLSVNPMSVSSVLGHTDEGKSNVFVNTSLVSGDIIRTEGRWRVKGKYREYKGLAVVASSCREEEIIRFVVEMD